MEICNEEQNDIKKENTCVMHQNYKITKCCIDSSCLEQYMFACNDCLNKGEHFSHNVKDINELDDIMNKYNLYLKQISLKEQFGDSISSVVAEFLTIFEQAKKMIMIELEQFFSILQQQLEQFRDDQIQNNIIIQKLLEFSQGLPKNKYDKDVNKMLSLIFQIIYSKDWLKETCKIVQDTTKQQISPLLQEYQSKVQQMYNSLVCNLSEINGVIIPLFNYQNKYFNIQKFQGQIVDEMKGHNDNISSLIQLGDDKIASSSYDKTIRIWNVNDRQQIKEINTEKQISCLVALEDNMLGCSNLEDFTISIWNITQAKVMSTLVGHNAYIGCIKKINNKQNTIISGGGDRNLIIWNYKHIIKIAIIKDAHQDNIFDVIQFSDNDLLSCGQDMTIRMFSLQTYQICWQYNVPNKHYHYRLVKISPQCIASGSNKEVYIWNIEQNQCSIIKIFQVHNSWIQSMCYLGNQLIATGSQDKQIKIVDLLTGTICQILHGHQQTVWCVINIENFIISAGVDNRIIVWN